MPIGLTNPIKNTGFGGMQAIHEYYSNKTDSQQNHMSSIRNEYPD